LPSGGGKVFEYNGVTHVSWWHDEYGYPAGSDSRRALAATGAGWMGLLTTWYMETRTSSAISPSASSTNDDDVVRRAIDEAHALGLKVMLKPHVPLTYAANANDAGDEFTSAAVWPLVDVLGLDVYTPLTSKTNPTRAELAAAWRRNRDGNDMVAAYRGLQAAWGKPLVFTEVGYRSADGANRAPWDWSASMGADGAEQADCYAAVYDVWSKESAWFRGPFWWAWDVSVPPAGDSGYDPRGKPAEELLRQWQK
jgi:hypothetical protein